MFDAAAYGHIFLRLVHDLVVSFTALLILYVFTLIGNQDASLLPLTLSPFIISFTYAMASVIGKFRTPNFKVQLAFILLAISISIAVNFFLGTSTQNIFLFHAVAFVLLSMPRYYLNLNRHNKSNFSKLALNNKGAVLIVGGAGYIGTHLIDVLLRANYSVRVLDKLMYGKEPIKDFISHPNFELIEGDATDLSKLVRAVNGCSAVVHLGGLVGDPACAVDPKYTRHENVISTRMVKEAAISSGVSRFIFASSCSVYGANDNIVDESSSLNPVSLYATTKIDSEKELLQSNNENFHVTILRFATVFGHSRRARFDLVGNLFSAQAYNEGKLTVIGSDQWRPFVHCRDLARAIETVLAASPTKIHGQVYNVGDDRLNMTIGDLGNKVKKVANDMDIKAELIVSDVVTDRRNYRVSFKKIKTQLGFECENTIESGVKEILENFKKGAYASYKSQQYSNLETTKQKVNLFYDPIHTNGIYRPLSEKETGTWG